MTGAWIVAGALVAVLAARVAGRLLGRGGWSSRASRRHGPPGVEAVVEKLENSTITDRGTGAVRSVQGADFELPESALDELWSPIYLERLAGMYWRFLRRATLGLIRVHYTPSGRSVVLIARPLKLLTFEAPEYEMDPDRGLVRWRIARGVLVARRGRGRGYLQIDVRRRRGEDPERAQLHVEVEVANFYPAIAFGLGQGLYNVTQSRLHVLITKSFLRSLARLDMPRSRVRRFETREESAELPGQGR